MTKGRLEAFSDGVLAIIITIMVLELHTPAGERLTSLGPLFPVFLAYVLSFLVIGIYWTNHHHLFQAVERINGAVLWGNLHLLFWLSLIPFGTAWVGGSEFAAIPVTIYGVLLLMAAIAYELLVRVLLAVHDADSHLRRAIGSDRKGKLSTLAYVAGILVAPWAPYLAWGAFLVVALVWIVPDARISRVLDHRDGHTHPATVEGFIEPTE